VTYLLHLWRNGCSGEANHQNKGIFKMSITGHATRRGLLAGIPAAAAAIAVPATATEEPKSIDAMLEGCSRKLKQHIMETVLGFVDACEDAKTGATDPVFAAIAAHKRAMADVGRAFHPDQSDDAACGEACNNECDTLVEFLLTEPTTIAGPLAALEFASSPNTNYSKPVLDLSFRGNDEIVDAAAAWPAIIGRHVRRLIETHGFLGTAAFGPFVVKG
jgi:hypothetical protein